MGRGLFLLLLLMFSYLNAQSDLLSHIVEIQKRPTESFPRFIRFDGSIRLSVDKHADFISTVYGLGSEFSLKLENRVLDQLGWEHFKIGRAHV